MRDAGEADFIPVVFDPAYISLSLTPGPLSGLLSAHLLLKNILILHICVKKVNNVFLC